MPRPKKATREKRVYDLRVSVVGSSNAPWRLIAVSADCTLPELHRTIQGAFDSRYVSEHCLVIRGTGYEGGKGSRTALRRVVDVGDVFACRDAVADRDYEAEVVRSYEVQNRRHHPKVLNGSGMSPETFGSFDLKVATWRAQDACRGYYPMATSFVPPKAPPHETHGRNGISRAGIDALEQLLARCGGELDRASEVHGFFTAVVSGPMVMPSEWLPVVVGENRRGWSSLAEMRSALDITMAVFNAVAQELSAAPGGFAVSIERVGEGADKDFAEHWCRGYLRGMALRPDDWLPLVADPEVRGPLGLIVVTGLHDQGERLVQPLAGADMQGALAYAAVQIYEYWRRRPSEMTAGTGKRVEERVPPNAPCPCGSGKKYKRCCGSPLRAI